jgi:ethanolaminephosphotransferase
LYIDANLGKADFINFKYNGGTDSITYQYLWSPFAEHLLKFVPLWLAPNLITFSALVILAVTNIIFMLPD